MTSKHSSPNYITFKVSTKDSLKQPNQCRLTGTTQLYITTASETLLFITVMTFKIA